MAIAYVNAEGAILEVAGRPSPFRKLDAGQRIVGYMPPAYDPESEVVTPVLPVTTSEVQFIITPLPNASDIRAARMLQKIDADVDDIYAKAVGNRGTEYAQAEAEALSFQASGFTLDPVPPYVLSWASVSGMTPQQAAESILAQAHQWRSAALLIRQGRLQAKAVVRAGGDLTAWDLFVFDVKHSLGIS